MRVLHIMSGFGGGISSFILNKAKYFNNKELIFDVITFDKVSNDFLSAIEGTGGKVYRISNPKVEGFNVFYNEVNNIMKKIPKDTFVHCHIIGYRAIPFYFIAKKNGLNRFGIHAHTTGMPDEINSFRNKLLRLINNTLATDKISCGQESSRYLFGAKYIAEDKIMHIPNSIDPQKFVKDLNVKKEDVLGIEAKNKLIIGHIGRFRSVKNHKFMLSVIEKLSKQSIDFLWVFAGDGDNFESIKLMAKKKELNKYVLFLGRRDDIAELLQVMDIFVLPSKYEGFPTVAIESQASNTQTILSDTITKEVDLQLGLVEYLSIKRLDEWVNYIVSFQHTNSITPEERINRLIEKKVTNEESAKLYKSFIEGKISYNPAS